MFEIEKGVPIPMMGRGRQVYPWDRMEVGDSFFVPSMKRYRFSGRVRTASKRYGVTFKLAQEGTGVRVWRVA